MDPSSGTSGPGWALFAVAVIAAVGAIVAAVIAARSAAQTQRNATEAARLLEAEKRLTAAKTEAYEPFVTAMSDFYDAVAMGTTTPSHTEELSNQFLSLTKWVQLYGSDDTVRALMRWRQAAFADVPAALSIRFVTDVLLELRRELGDSKTTINVLELLALRLTDAYSDGEIRDIATLPLEQACAKYSWTPPWAISFA